MGPRGERRIIKGASREGHKMNRGRPVVGGAKKKTGQLGKRTRDSDSEEENRMDMQENQRACRK